VAASLGSSLLEKRAPALCLEQVLRDHERMMMRELRRVGVSVTACMQLMACASAHEHSLPPPSSSPLEGEEVTHVVSNCTADTNTIEQVDLDAQTALGFSARDVLEYVLGQHDTALHWASRETLVRTPKSSGEQTLHVGIELRGDEARVIDPHMQVVGHGLVCNMRMEIDVTVTLQSDDGAFNERFDATLATQSVASAFLEASTDSSMLGGKLAVRDSASYLEDPEPFQMGMTLSVSNAGVAGRLTGTWYTLPGEFEFGGTERYVLADFGDTHCDPWQYVAALEDDIAGVRPEALLDRTRKHERMRITWSDGTETNLTLSFEPEPAACVSDSRNQSEPTRSVHVLGKLELSSADGRLSGVYDGHVAAYALEPPGAFSIGLMAVDADAATVTPAQLGFPMQSRAGFDSLELTMNISVDASDAVNGMISLTAYENIPCADEPELICEWIPTVLELGTLR
jgi:hypothetical protein